jgi:small-conductance mechanosensitive channel
VSLPTAWISHVPIARGITSLVILLAGTFFAITTARLVERWCVERYDARRARILRRVFHYSAMVLVILIALDELGVGIGVLLGAAGILSLGLGFASQTALSNIISGLFLLGEHSFSMGDFIQVGNLTGEVLAIDLLSVKLRTYDNLYVRVPNETLIKGEITNLTRLPIRRVDLSIGVAYASDLNVVRDALLGLARQSPLCLEEPAPTVVFSNFGSSTVNLLFSVWIRRQNYSLVMNELARAVICEFRERGIDLPYPQQTVHFSSTDPLRIEKEISGTRIHPESEP